MTIIIIIIVLKIVTRAEAPALNNREHACVEPNAAGGRGSPRARAVLRLLLSTCLRL